MSPILWIIEEVFIRRISCWFVPGLDNQLTETSRLTIYFERKVKTILVFVRLQCPKTIKNVYWYWWQSTITVVYIDFSDGCLETKSSVTSLILPPTSLICHQKVLLFHKQFLLCHKQVWFCHQHLKSVAIIKSAT